MNLFKTTTVMEGIAHIEDLPLDEFIKTVKDLKDKSVTEKLDGANLWFGVDEKGLFTSREGKRKNAERWYSVDEYPMIASFNGFRAAHLALKKAETAIKHVLSNGDMIEIEVLFGRQPNTVTYGHEDKNFIVILRAVENTPQEKADKLAKILDGKSVTITSKVVTSPDGDQLVANDEKMVWQFTSVKPLDTSSIDMSQVMQALKSMEEWLASPAQNVAGKTNREVIEINLGSVDKAQRAQVKAERERLQQVLLTKFKEPIKDFLLNTIVRKVKPALQSKDVQPDEDVGVEGVVIRDNKTGELTKIVDKDVFTAINKFNNSIRGQVAGLVKTDDQNAPIESRGGVFGQAKIRIGNLLGMKELALSSSAKKLIAKFKGANPAETATNLANEIQVTDFEAIRRKVAAILKSSLTDIDQILAQFKENAGSYKLKLKTGKEIGMSPEVMKRNLTAFAETKRDVNQVITAVLKARTMPELIMSLYGRTIQSIFDNDGEDSVKESLFKSIANKIDEDGEAPVATTSADTGGGSAQPQRRLFGNRVIVKRQRKFVPKTKFARGVTEGFSLLKEFDGTNNYNQFATDVDDSAAAKTDVEFKQLRNNVGPGANGNPVSQGDVSNYLDKAHELNDEVDTVTFGMEMDDGSVAKVYVNATQADEFEKTLAELLGQEDDLEKVINDLSSQFDIVDVEWPEQYGPQGAQAAGQQGMDEPAVDSDGAKVLDPVIDLGTMDDPPEDEEDGGLLKSINGMKNPDDIELPPGAELPPEEQGEGISPEEAAARKAAKNGEEEPSDGTEEGDSNLMKDVNGDVSSGDTGGTGDTASEQPPADTGGGGEDEEGGEKSDTQPEDNGDGSGGENAEPSMDSIGDEGESSDTEQAVDDENSDEENSDEENAGNEEKPKKKKPKSDEGEEQETKESVMSFGQKFKDKLLLEKKEEKKEVKKPVVKKDEDAAEDAHDFPAALKKLMQFFPARGEKMMVALMWALGAPLEAMVMKKSELRQTVGPAGERFQKDSQLRLWVGRVIDAMLESEKAPKGPAVKDKKDEKLKEAKLEDELNSVIQKMVLGMLDRIGMPSSIERIARIQLRANVKAKALLIQKDTHLRAYTKILAELLGVDGVTGMALESLGLTEKQIDEARKEFKSEDDEKQIAASVRKHNAAVKAGTKDGLLKKAPKGWEFDSKKKLVKKEVEVAEETLNEFGSEDFLNSKPSAGVRTQAAANDEGQPQQQGQEQETPEHKSASEAWIDSVKQLAIALGIPEGNVQWKEMMTNTAIKKRMSEIQNRAAIQRRIQQLMQLLEK